MKQLQFVGITPIEVADLIDERLNKRFTELKKSFQPKEQSVYLTRQEVAKMLSVDLSTIHNWSKRKILQPVSICSRVYFKRSEVENAIVKLEN